MILSRSLDTRLNAAGKGGIKILVITGASGGHIFPALSFLETLKDKHKNIETLLILPKRNIKNPTADIGCRVNYISISSIKFSLDFKNILAILKFFKGFFESASILLKFKPDVVVGFGSVVCVPTILLAWILRIKTLIHEQNVMPGRATRFLAIFADSIAISFAETKDYFKTLKRNIVLTGNPIRGGLKRYDKHKALDYFGFSDDKFTILVMGGSQGSHGINIGFLKAMSTISHKSILQVIHLTGYPDYDLLRNSYKGLNINIKLFTFLQDMQYAYGVSDLVVSRAGATTIAEIIYFKLPAVIIPYPFAYKHQLSNALVLERLGSAIIINDSELYADKLRWTIDNLINNHDQIKSMRSRYDNISMPHIGDLLVNEALSFN